jgi:hypothetical protein
MTARSLPLLLLALLLGCPPSLGRDDDDAGTDDDDATGADDDDLVGDDDDDSTGDDDDLVGDDDDSTGDDDDDVVVGVAVPVERCDEQVGNDFALDGWTLSGDLLIASVTYGGGCEVHDFRACWDGSFLESQPVQARLTLKDLGPPDPCDALISESITIDLIPLQDAWVAGYGPPPGEIVINLGAGSASYAF